ncbi:class I SAM-dependent methyltransferase [Aeoliella sp. SH292]|uniref:class I SAM-dependent methyltransferase n=1 Tax=Aeoliella sp. SH292 TaxID=3454464 RepID=UPI003F9D2BB3
MSETAPAKELVKIDVGCGQTKRPGWVGLDVVDLPGVDICHDLKQFPWPIESDTASEIILDNVIEHLPDTVATMNELHRITAKGGKVELLYPYFRSKGAYGDPTHVRFFNEFMIEYFLVPGSTSRRENAYSFYTDKHWRLVSRSLITYPFLKWMPMWMLQYATRIVPLDIIHCVRLTITPDK